jgi:tetratricopeptide (TPR) repeat protein
MSLINDNSLSSKIANATSFVGSQFKEHRVRTFTVLGSVVVLLLLFLLIVSRIQKYDIYASDKYSQGYGTIIVGNQAQGLAILEDLIKVYPKTPASFEARLLLSEYNLSLSNFSQALNYLFEVSNKGNPKAMRPLGLYRIIVIYDQTNDVDNAIRYAKEFTEKYKDHFLVKDVYMNLARFYLIKNLPQDAKKVYSDIVAKFPATDEATIAMRLLENIN